LARGANLCLKDKFDDFRKNTKQMTISKFKEKCLHTKSGYSRINVFTVSQVYSMDTLKFT